MKKGYFFIKKMWMTLRYWFLVALFCMDGIVPYFIYLKTREVMDKEYVVSKILYGSTLPLMLLGLLLLFRVFFEEEGCELLYVKSKSKLNLVLTLETISAILSIIPLLTGAKYLEQPSSFLFQYVSVLFLFGSIYYMIIYIFSSNLFAVFIYFLFFIIPFLFPDIKECFNYMVVQKYPLVYALSGVICFTIGAIINNRKITY